MTEKYLCLNCHNIAPLTDTLHCAACGSDSVVTTELLKTAAKQLQLIDAHYYKLEYQGFVSMVDSRDAIDEKAAIEFATHDCNHPWYLAHDYEVGPGITDAVLVSRITRSQYCDWLRSKY